MKKFALVLSVVALVASSMMTAFAASVEVGSIVTVGTSKSESGAVVGTYLNRLTTEQQTKVDEVTEPDALKEVLGDNYSDSLKVVDALDFVVDEANKEDLAAGIDVTFNVPGVTVGSSVQFLQYYDGAWQVIEGLVAADGTVTATLYHEGPIVFLAEGATGGVTTTPGTTTDGSTSSTTTSPQTGEGTVVVVAAVAAVALAGVVVSRKKTA